MRIRHTTALVLATALLCGGCAIDEEQLLAWTTVEEGQKRLAAYLADPARPHELRARAARHLYEMNEMGHLIGVLKSLEERDRDLMVPSLGAIAERYFGHEVPDYRGRATDFAYHLMEVGRTSNDERVQASMTRLALSTIGVVLDGFPPKGSGNSAVNALQAAALTAPKRVIPKLAEFVDGSQAPMDILAFGDAVKPLKEPILDRHVAQAMLRIAKQTYPNIPPILAMRMVANGNPTLLRYLLDATRDPRLPAAIFNIALEGASDKLGRDAIPGLQRLLKAEHPGVYNEPRWIALEALWRLGGVEYLEQTLTAMPPEGTWPTRGTDFKDEVSNFCTRFVAKQKEPALPALERLLESTNWVARLFAVTCIGTLFPERAPALLVSLEEDLTPVPGWEAEADDTTIGKVVRGFLEPE